MIQSLPVLKQSLGLTSVRVGVPERPPPFSPALRKDARDGLYTSMLSSCAIYTRGRGEVDD
jgi:hypothetical protein